MLYVYRVFQIPEMLEYLENKTFEKKMFHTKIVQFEGGHQIKYLDFGSEVR